MREVDLHGFELADAIVEIHFALKECKLDSETHITFIHGYRSGSVIQNYIRSQKFIAQLAKEGYKLKKIKSKHQGATSFRIQ